jgi:hypothetical protein
MKVKNDIIFHVCDDFGKLHPVRVGDILRVKDMGHRWRLEGKLVLVLDTLDYFYTIHVSDYDKHESQQNELLAEEAYVLVDGAKEIVRVEYLEPLED